MSLALRELYHGVCSPSHIKVSTRCGPAIAYPRRLDHSDATATTSARVCRSPDPLNPGPKPVDTIPGAPASDNLFGFSPAGISVQTTVREGSSAGLMG